MRRLTYAFLCVALTTLAPLPAGETKLEPGYKLLFNGKNLDGWRSRKDKGPLDGMTEAYQGRFKVVDGKLIINPAVKGDLYIETAKEFTNDVHLKLDFRPGLKCNNDVFLRGTKFDLVLKLKGVKEGEWNTLDIIITGDKVEHKINGETARKATTKSKSSTFMLRAEFGAIEYRNIRIKEGS